MPLPQLDTHAPADSGRTRSAEAFSRRRVRRALTPSATARNAGRSHAALRERLVLPVVVLACAAAILRTILFDSFDGPWLPVARVMDYTADPPWNHRLLFVWLANAVRALIPGTTAFQAYFASQAVAAFLALGLVAQWVSHFVPRHRVWLAPILLTLIVVPTITYRTFFDLGIIAVFALGLTLVHRGRIIAFSAVLAIGTLNHEITLLLIPVFVALHRDRAPSRRWLVGWTAIQVGLWVGVRAALFEALPTHAMWQSGKFAYNLDLVLHLKPEFLSGMSVILFWFVLGALALPRIGRELRRCLWLLPGNVVVVLLVGQINEPRLFDAFLPVLVGVMLQGLHPHRVEDDTLVRRITRARVAATRS